MTQKLYTVILEYRGGTYISQVTADSAPRALPKWLSELKDQDLSSWGIGKNELSTMITSDDLTPIENCVGVWCLTGSAGDHLVLINVIATDKEGKS